MTVLRREGRSLISRVEKAEAFLRKAASRLLGAVLVPSTRTSLRSHLGDPFLDGQRRPEETDQLPSNGNNDLVVLLSS